MRKHHILALVVAVVIGLDPSAHQPTSHQPTSHQPTPHQPTPEGRSAHGQGAVTIAVSTVARGGVGLTSRLVVPPSWEPQAPLVRVEGPGWAVAVARAPRAARPVPAAAPVVAPPAPPAPDPWTALRWCESGDDYEADTGNGYYGAYQFTADTWASLGLPGLPSQAPPSVQDQAAEELQAQSGWGQWPACAAELGLT